MRYIILFMLPFTLAAQKKIRISVPDGTSIDSTVIVGGWGIEAVESPANTWNLVADTSQVATQYDLTAKQNNITLTTTGTSGAATLIGSTLNIPNYSTGAGTGTVTSVATSAPITGGTITTSGTIGLSYDNTYMGLNGSNQLYPLYNVATWNANQLRGSSIAIPFSPTTGQVLAYNGSAWAPANATSGGTVTSVGIANGGGISITGTNPITSSGTITLTAADQSATNEIQSLSYNSGLGQMTISSGNTVTIPNFSTLNKGLAPVSPGGTTTFLRADGNWATPAVAGGLTTTGTAGQVGYHVTSAGITSLAGSSSFYWDNANIRLGLGTAAPSRLLDVNGSVRFRSVIYDSNNSGGNTGQNLKSNGVGAWYWGYDGNHTYGLLRNSTSSTTNITTTASKVLFDDSNNSGDITASATNDQFVLNHTGTGTFNASITMQVEGADNRNIIIELHNSTTGQIDNYTYTTTKPVNNIITININRLIQLSSGTFYFIVKYDSATGSGTDIKYRYAHCSIVQIK